MPCDTRLLTLKEVLQLATEQLSTSERCLVGCRAQLERSRACIQTAQESLDRASFDEAQARQAYIDWLSHLNTLSDDRSAPVREKLTSLYNARTQAVLDTLSVRETVSSFENLLDEATADLALAPDAQRNIAEERNLITTEIAKLGGLAR